jgi:eukaryotic-like serine/threonine-protein kinase
MPDPSPNPEPSPATESFVPSVRTADYDARSSERLLAGRYRLLEPVGEGGMGTVWKAEQTEPVRRLVAVKLIKSGGDSKAVLARFEAERQALAMMDHPNIAKVLDADVTDDGRPFFVMELVRGEPITRYCTAKNLDAKQRLELFMPVCQAIQHAHQKGIIHRDIKPSNVLVAEYDGRPVPKVIDFGVAKAAGGRLTDTTLQTGHGAIVGTPEYMSPEQAADSADIDTRSDVYALGVLIYEMLTGAPPHDRAKLKAAGLLEILRVVREEEPPPPSSKLTNLRVPNVQELDWIVLKALEKDRARRYDSANALAADIQRHLANETVSAGPPGAGYRLRKFARRHRAAVLGSLAILFALVAGLTGAVWGLIEARHQRDAADQARRLALDEKRDADAARIAESEARAKAETARKTAEAEQARAETERIAKEKAAVRADGLRLGAEATNALRTDPALSLLLAIEGVKRHPHHLTFAALADAAAALHETKTIANIAAPLAVFPDGQRFACAVTNGYHGERAKARAVTIFDSAGQPGVSWPGFGLDVGAIALSPDGTKAATALIGAMLAEIGDGEKKDRALYTARTVYVWDTASGRDRVHLRGHAERVVSVEFSPDGSRVLTASFDGTARQWNATTGEPIGPPMAHECSLLLARYSPDGSRILAVPSGRVEFEDSWKEFEKAPNPPKFDPGPTERPIRFVNIVGKQSGSASAGDSFAARVWDAATGKQVAGLRRKRTAAQLFHNWTVTQGRFSPDGKQVALAFTDKFAGVWDATKDGAELYLLTGHEAAVNDVGFTSNGQTIQTVSDDGRLHEYRAGSGAPTFLNGYGGGAKKAVRHAKDERWRLVIGATDLAVWPGEAHKGSGGFASFLGHRGRIVDAAFLGPDAVVSLGSDYTARLWSIAKPPELATLVPHGAPKVAAIDVSPDGARLAVAGTGDDATVRILDLRTGAQLAEIGKDAVLGNIRSVRFHPDGTQIVTASDVTTGSRGGKVVNNSAVHVWDAKTGEDLYSLPTHVYAARFAAFLSDGRRILTVADGSKRSLGAAVSGSRSSSEFDGWARVWDATTRRVAYEVVERIQGYGAPAIAPDGARFALTTKVGAIVFDAATGQEAWRAADQAWPCDVALSPPNAPAISWSSIKITLRDPATGTSTVEFPRPATVAPVHSRDGRWIAVPSLSAVLLIDARSGEIAKTLIGHESPVRGVAFTPDGARLLSFADDRTAAVWDLPTGALRVVHRAPTPIRHAAFRPDGGVATAGDDGVVRLWPADPVAVLRKRSPRALTSIERARYDVRE